MEFFITAFITAIIYYFERTVHELQPHTKLTRRMKPVFQLLLFGFIMVSMAASPLLAPSHTASAAPLPPPIQHGPLSIDPSAPLAAATISGTVYQDSNLNGTKDAPESGLSGVTVTAYDSTGTNVGSATTIGDGTYTLNASGTQPYRIEFTGLPSGYISGPSGANNGTTVVFVTGSVANLDLGVHVPETCSPPTGTLLNMYPAAASCSVITSIPNNDRFTFGLMDISNAVPASGRVNQTSSTPMFHHPDWHVDVLGNVYGVAVDDSTGTIYVGATTNLSSGFWGKDAIVKFGSLGTAGANDIIAGGTVFRLDPVTGEPSVFARLPQQGANFTHIDCEGYDTVTRTNTGVGLGNLTHDASHNQLFVANWEDGRI